MSGKGGGKDFLEDTLDAAVNLTTGGLVGYKDGKLSKGVDVKMLDRFTGRDLQKEQMRIAEARAAKEEQLRERAVADEREVKRRNDVVASNAAGGVKRVAAKKENLALGNPLDEGNFLGL